MDLHSRWEGAWQSLGVAPDPALSGKLLAAHGEPQRHYHTLVHLQECLAHFDELRTLAGHPGEIELALWFHDAIYNPRRHDNEERSAAWAAQALSPVSQEAASRVHGLVMATKHATPPEGTDAQILVDVDLSILGAGEERFDEYEAQVRAEHAWVREPLYRRARRKIVQGFLARPKIFSTARFVERYEAQARTNLARSLARL